jgi:hypothetical protein
VVDRVVRLSEPYRATMHTEHLRIDDVFRRFSGRLSSTVDRKAPVLRV